MPAHLAAAMARNRVVQPAGTIQRTWASLLGRGVGIPAALPAPPPPPPPPPAAAAAVAVAAPAAPAPVALVWPTIRSIANLNTWIAQGSVNSRVFFVTRTRQSVGTKWDVGFTFYLRQAAGGGLQHTWYWHAHFQGNRNAVARSVDSSHFKDGHAAAATQLADDAAGEALALLGTLRTAHGFYVAGNEQTL